MFSVRLYEPCAETQWMEITGYLLDHMDIKSGTDPVTPDCIGIACTQLGLEMSDQDLFNMYYAARMDKTPDNCLSVQEFSAFIACIISDHFIAMQQRKTLAIFLQ